MDRKDRHGGILLQESFNEASSVYERLASAWQAADAFAGNDQAVISACERMLVLAVDTDDAEVMFHTAAACLEKGLDSVFVNDQARKMLLSSALEAKAALVPATLAAVARQQDDELFVSSVADIYADVMARKLGHKPPEAALKDLRTVMLDEKTPAPLFRGARRLWERSIQKIKINRRDIAAAEAGRLLRGAMSPGHDCPARLSQLKDAACEALLSMNDKTAEDSHLYARCLASAAVYDGQNIALRRQLIKDLAAYAGNGNPQKGGALTRKKITQGLAVQQRLLGGEKPFPVYTI